MIKVKNRKKLHVEVGLFLGRGCVCARGSDFGRWWLWNPLSLFSFPSQVNDYKKEKKIIYGGRTSDGFITFLLPRTFKTKKSFPSCSFPFFSHKKKFISLRHFFSCFLTFLFRFLTNEFLNGFNYFLLRLIIKQTPETLSLYLSFSLSLSSLSLSRTQNSRILTLWKFFI